jgi:hypothetical protein
MPVLDFKLYESVISIYLAQAVDLDFMSNTECSDCLIVLLPPFHQWYLWNTDQFAGTNT